MSNLQSLHLMYLTQELWKEFRKFGASSCDFKPYMEPFLSSFSDSKYSLQNSSSEIQHYSSYFESLLNKLSEYPGPRPYLIAGSFLAWICCGKYDEALNFLSSSDSEEFLAILVIFLDCDFICSPSCSREKILLWLSKNLDLETIIQLTKTISFPRKLRVIEEMALHNPILGQSLAELITYISTNSQHLETLGQESLSLFTIAHQDFVDIFDKLQDWSLVNPIYQNLLCAYDAEALTSPTSCFSESTHHIVKLLKNKSTCFDDIPLQIMNRCMSYLLSLKNFVIESYSDLDCRFMMAIATKTRKAGLANLSDKILDIASCFLPSVDESVIISKVKVVAMKGQFDVAAETLLNHLMSSGTASIPIQHLCLKYMSKSHAYSDERIRNLFEECCKSDPT